MWAQKLIHHKICFILYFKCINEPHYRCECDPKESSRLTLFFFEHWPQKHAHVLHKVCVIYCEWQMTVLSTCCMWSPVQWAGRADRGHRANKSPPPGGSASFSIHKTHTPPTMLCSQCCHKIIDPIRSLISMNSSISFQQPAMKASVKKVYIQARLPL